MLAIFKCRCLFALSSSLTFLIPYFSRKGNDNTHRKILSLPVFRLHCNLDRPSHQGVWLRYSVSPDPAGLTGSGGTRTRGEVGWALQSYPSSLWTREPVLSPVPTQSRVLCRGKICSSPSLKSLGESFHFRVSVVWAWWIITIISLPLEPLHHSYAKGCLKKLQDNERRNISSASVKLAYIRAWVWAEDLNAFLLSLNKVTYPITREIPNE